MSRRRRSLALVAAALIAAAAAAGLADRYGTSVAAGYGPLRSVVVLRRSLGRRRIDSRTVASALSLRRVPERFAPPGALASPAAALGMVPAVPLPAGSYLLAALLRRDVRPRRPAGRLGPTRTPVEITVSGAAALLAAGGARPGARVDVVLGPPPGGTGRARIGAAAVPLLALRAGPEGRDPGATAAATVGVARREALRLIAAEGEGRRMTLLPRP